MFIFFNMITNSAEKSYSNKRIVLHMLYSAKWYCSEEKCIANIVESPQNWHYCICHPFDHQVNQMPSLQHLKLAEFPMLFILQLMDIVSSVCLWKSKLHSQKTNSASNMSREMEFFSFNFAEEGEHNCGGFLEMSQTFVMQDATFFGTWSFNAD